MQDTTARYKSFYSRLKSGGSVWYEVRAYISDTSTTTELYEMDRIVSLETSHELFSGGSPGIGGTVAGMIDIEVRNPGTIIKKAKIIPYIRMADGANYTEWIMCGIYYVDTREIERVSGNVTLHGYDHMIFMERYLYRCLPSTPPHVLGEDVSDYFVIDVGSEWDIDYYDWESLDIMERIANYIDVELDDTGVADFVVHELESERYPQVDDGVWYGLSSRQLQNLSMREMAGYIAAASGGNWTIVCDSEGNPTLKLIPLSTSGVTDVNALGQSVATLTTASAYTQWNGVRFSYPGMDDVTVGTQGSGTLTAQCPFAASKLTTFATTILNAINGQIYYPYEATGALLDPAAELGDLVTIDGITSVIASINMSYGTLCTATVSAPSDANAIHELTEDDPAAIEFLRSNSAVAQTRVAVNSDLDYLSKRIEVMSQADYDALDAAGSVNMQKIYYVYDVT